MSRAGQARRVVRAAAMGGGGLGMVGAATTALLLAEAKLARWAIRLPDAPPPLCSGDYGTGYAGRRIDGSPVGSGAAVDGRPLTMALLGDSTAAGLGADLPAQTPGALLASGLADILSRPVRLRSFAVVGALSVHLHEQLELARQARPDLAVVLIGGNDVTHLVRPAVAVRHLTTVVRGLRETGAEVVVGTCPDLGTIQPIRQPLRWMCRRASRQLAAAQTIAVVEAGGRTVSLGDLLGPEFLAAPDELFSADRFHPSPAGYAKAAAAILPTIAAAVGGLPEPAAGPVRSLPEAAAAAAECAGTEVCAATAAGGRRLGRLARLSRRVRLLAARPTGPRQAIPRQAAPAQAGPVRVDPEPATES